MSLQRVAQESRQQLKQQQAFVSRVLTTAHQHAVNLIKPLLDRLIALIKGKQQQGEPVTLSWLYEDSKMQHVLDAITTHLNQFGETTRSTVVQAMQRASNLSTKAAGAMLDLLGITPRTANTRDQSPMDQLFHGYGQEAAKLARAALLLGVSLKQSVQEIMRRIIDVLNISFSRAITVASTEMARVFKETMLDYYRAHPDILGWIWICQLSPSSCAACVAMHGTIHSLNEVLQDHPNGFCTMLPYTKLVHPIVPSGEEWFARQSEAVQRAILGTAKYNAWRYGKFNLSSLAGHTHDPQYGSSIYEKSLKELVKG